MIRKKIGTRLEKIVSNYFSNHYTTSFSVFEDFKATVEGIELDAQTMSHLQRLLQIFFLGQLLNLHTLNSIFVRFGIANGYDKVRYKDIRNKLTNNKLHQIFEYVFEQKLIEILLPLAQKDSSALSRTMVTVVLDDSVFKQWLTMQTAEVSEEDSQFYARFFSGQIGRTAAGYQVVALGVNVGGIYYPLYFQCVPKTPLTAKERLDKIAALAAVLAAKRLEKKVLLEKINLDKANMSTDEDKKAIKILKLNIKVKEEAIRVAKKALSMVKNIKKVVEKKVVAVLLIEKWVNLSQISKKM